MAKIVKKKITFTPSTGEDVVAHRIYAAPAPDELSYNSVFVEVAAPKAEVIVPDEFPAMPLRDVEYKLGITAVDDAGNESDMAQLTTPFDFAAPDAPSNVAVEDV